jgi:hypothetical protein
MLWCCLRCCVARVDFYSPACSAAGPRYADGCLHQTTRSCGKLLSTRICARSLFCRWLNLRTSFVRTGVLSLGGWGKARSWECACCCSYPPLGKLRWFCRSDLLRYGDLLHQLFWLLFAKNEYCATVVRLHTLRCVSSSSTVLAMKHWIETIATEQQYY